MYVPFLGKYHLATLRSLVMIRVLWMILVKFSIGLHNFPICGLCHDIQPGVCLL